MALIDRTQFTRNNYATQGGAAERMMAHMESFRTNAVDTRATYVAISRAQTHAALIY